MAKNHDLLQDLLEEDVWAFKELFPSQIPRIPEALKCTTSVWMDWLTSFVGSQSFSGISNEPWSPAKDCGISKVLIKSIHLLEADKEEVRCHQKKE